MREYIPPEIAKHEDILVAKIRELFGDDAAIDPETRSPGGYWNADGDVCGVLVTTRSGHGAVRTIGAGEEENVETGPGMKSRYYIVVVKEGQSCAFLGQPSFRLIKRQKA
ncbi:uncharacterized protein NECHADRAFT_82989 [Fusarium vanettenii 77-13-4]|uniref:Uncharacterized protein n=1 Tax=Fusarium vanettenii (strain ATCC MYA-4622 / CBS 123669 / FGSC 9596 / NRRL 45880 / 77-13-4) TaxID=660122 RepID=C7ZAU8_FUSV7|nr:uncharacterized protein NECHADRAFT_82989 [Fusarium vanettenii 77-13-4]EEU38638.1 predicted protein [Fusarium vanettenii 77-13-4]